MRREKKRLVVERLKDSGHSKLKRRLSECRPLEKNHTETENRGGSCHRGEIGKRTLAHLFCSPRREITLSSVLKDA